MKLLTFAYRGEAQHFLKSDNYKEVDSESKGLFKNENNYLLITGEGIESTTKRMNTVFKKIGSEILKVINLGIVGALDKNLELGSIHSIHEVYLEEKNESFLSADKKAIINCITAKNRVVNKNYSNQLLQTAPIVDMELWACAKVCNKYEIPFLSFKLISDYAGNSTNSESIIKKAKVFIEKLYSHYHNRDL